jgi:hypothetical protein
MTQQGKWKKLGEWKDKGVITRCPGGMVHLSYNNLTLHFDQAEFLEFARVVSEAVVSLLGSTLSDSTLSGLNDLQSKLSTSFSDN